MEVVERDQNGRTSVIDLTPVSDLKNQLEKMLEEFSDILSRKVENLNPDQKRYLTEMLNIAMKSKTKFYEWIMKNPEKVSRINELYEQLKKCEEECSYGRLP